MAVDEAREMAEEAGSQDGSDGGGGSGLSSLMSKDVLIPAAATAAAAAAAGLAAKKGPDLMKKLTGSAEGEAEEIGRQGAEGAKQALGGGGGAAGAVGKAASKLMGGGGQSGGKTRRLPIQRWTDIAVPVEEAYERWTNFEDFPKFMHRVLEVKQEEDDKIHWREKIWFSTRDWDGEITEKRKNDRIAWKSVSGTQHSGVISFHKLDTRLTRVLVTVDFVPTGMIEKMASGMRFVKRAVEADLARFKAYVEFGAVKGLEYRSKPEEMEQHREDGEEDKGQNDGDDRSQAGGQAGTSESRKDDDQEREAQREEREKRRKERQEALSSS